MSGRCYDQISRHGLTEVYRPIQGGDRPVAHIIFVHGLFGHPEKTWTGTKKARQAPSVLSSRSGHPSEEVRKEDGKTAEDSDPDLPDVFWPAAILSKVVPNTKIWTWGYDADIDGFWSSASHNTVAQHATNLLSDVADLLEIRDCNLPIIFVVHSLGGLIIKAALNTSAGARGNRLKVVVPVVHGILFLGTPHRGSKSASIGKMAFQITKAAARRPNEKLLQALERNSDTLDQINNSFLQTLEEYNNIAVSSFREEKETRKFLFFSTIVVEADSARIGLAREELNSIPANHRHMAKLSSPEDVGFKRVSAQIRRWIQSLPVAADNDSQEYIDCVRSLDSSATKARLKNVAASHNETLQWLFDSNVVDFSSWLQDSDENSSSIYWVQGKPGSGKSTLMKFAMMDPRLSDLLQISEQLPYVISGFFFHDRGTMVQKSISGMLQELLHSILVKSSALRQFVHPIYVALVDAQKTRLPTWDVESLQQGFEAIVRQRKIETRLCLFLDALDEHHGDNENLASIVKKVVALADRNIVKIKVCLASRPWDTFVMNFSQCPGFKIQDHTYNDIRAYTLSEFQHSSPAGTKDFSTGNARSTKLEALATQVTEKAHGVFIWVRIVVEEITKGLRARTPLFVLEEMLAKMPEELKDLYEHTLERIEPGHAKEGLIMLKIALCALSPLLLDTFVNTTSQALWGKVPDIGEESLEDMMQRVVSRSGGLLEVIESIPMDISIASGSGRRNTGVLVTEVEITFNEPSVVASGEDLEPKLTHITHRVQFIHQTVKEYVQNREIKSSLEPFRFGEIGFHYILAAAVTNHNQWADEIGLDMFEYARIAGSNKDFMVQRNLRLILYNLDVPGPTSRARWWITRKRMDFYTHCFQNCSAQELILGLALAAGLFEYFDDLRLIWHDIDWYRLLYVATIGPPVTSVQTPRRDMLNILFQYKNLARHPVIGISPLNNYRELPSPLALVIVTKYKLDQDETERTSAIAFLLDHGADPNQSLDGLYSPGSTLFSKCIKQESAEVVRLFGQYGAVLPREMILPVRSLWQMISRPSPVLKEVIQIMQRNYPVNLDETWPPKPFISTWTATYESSWPAGDFYGDYYFSAAAPLLATIAAMGVGVGSVFLNTDS